MDFNLGYFSNKGTQDGVQRLLVETKKKQPVRKQAVITSKKYRSISRVLNQVVRKIGSTVDRGLRNRVDPFIFIGVGFFCPGAFIFSEPDYIIAPPGFPGKFTYTLGINVVQGYIGPCR